MRLLDMIRRQSANNTPVVEKVDWRVGDTAHITVRDWLEWGTYLTGHARIAALYGEVATIEVTNFPGAVFRCLVSLEEPAKGFLDLMPRGDEGVTATPTVPVTWLRPAK